MSGKTTLPEKFLGSLLLAVNGKDLHAEAPLATAAARRGDLAYQNLMNQSEECSMRMWAQSHVCQNEAVGEFLFRRCPSADGSDPGREPLSERITRLR